MQQIGFRINVDKTVGVIFSRKKKLQIPDLDIDNKKIQFCESVKFLGVTFDSRLNWSAHIEYVIERVKPRLNIMRCISGTNWGASKDILLLLYRALLRPILEYGSVAFEMAQSPL